ncbi:MULTISPECIES: CDP-diacylglycerol--serine O-phosphatidyltransferase [Nitrospirillum]|uniref:CDP-diacylglycerol--serine O-phosphatidyltransferase n=1 Tax=Nitrospirillum amazonense TaxID=28077 RepID=A0A560G514_9PROT|nr:CDP-diacylglycerol--serine O-phosphatidyltransferase [Nitrospirillum amazonense]MEC4591363.1 CDP-diacylglycerol--serine O-phosphatidyltransferase [Nitrospirillum amazonense]TWB28976.1 CDP-diacylglycerol--serine O-phosphatidyltransferase [Nitrospirillum amazonense]
MVQRPPRTGGGALGRRRRAIRPPRLGGLTINKLLPNMLTVLALSAGMTGIRFATEQRWEHAVVAIVVAAVLDALDGRIARLLNAQSKFGAELDSLSDVVSFGVAPAMILYMWGLNEARSFGWIACLLFGACAALRLARFNTALGSAAQKPVWAYNYFTGVPAPAGAGLALLPIVASFEMGRTVVGHPAFVVVWTVGMAALMISAIPTFSLKGLRIHPRYVVFIFLGLVLLAAGVVSAPWTTLLILGVGYLATLPFSVRQYQRLMTQAESLVGAEPEGPEGVMTEGVMTEGAVTPESGAIPVEDPTIGQPPVPPADGTAPQP